MSLQPPATLSMPDPCPHVTRIMLIGARLRGADHTILEHLETCQQTPDTCDGCGMHRYVTNVIFTNEPMRLCEECITKT